MPKKLLIPLGIAGAGLGMGIVGDALNSQGLKDAGTQTNKYVAPAVNIVMGGYLINQVRQIDKKKILRSKIK